MIPCAFVWGELCERPSTHYYDMDCGGGSFWRWFLCGHHAVAMADKVDVKPLEPQPEQVSLI